MSEISDEGRKYGWIGPLFVALRVSTPEAAIGRVDALLAREKRADEMVAALRILRHCRTKPICRYCLRAVDYALRDEEVGS